MATIGAVVDASKQGIGLIGLEQHIQIGRHHILQPLTAGKPVAQAMQRIDEIEDIGVDFARPVLAGPGAGQCQQVDIGPNAAGFFDFATGQERLHRQCPAKGQGHIRVRSGLQTKVLQLIDKARY